MSPYDALVAVSGGAFDAGFVGRLVELVEHDSLATTPDEAATAAA